MQKLVSVIKNRIHVFLLILLFSLLRPSIIFELIKNIFNKITNNVYYPNVKEIEDFVNLGALTYKPNDKDIIEITNCNKTIKSLLFLDRYIFKKVLFTYDKYGIFINNQSILKVSTTNH